MSMPYERILIVEDHPDLLKEMSQVLSEAGYQVQTATTGADAIALARQSAFDLVLADIFLPDGSGIDFFRQMREQHPDLAGVVVTAHSTWELALDALRAGFVGFLVKPIVPEQLLTSVLSALEQEKLRRENARLRALVPLYELSRTFMGTIALQDVLNQIVNIVRQENPIRYLSR
jgi:Response regulator containing CheY-like receiver, AAA-type ATPase, and DNA-binding domains